MLKAHSNFLRLPKGAGLTVLQVDLLSRPVSYLNNAPARRDKRIVETLERLLDLERIGQEKIERRKRKIENDRIRVSLFSVFDSEWYTSRWGVSGGAEGLKPDRPEEASPLDTFFALARSGHLSQLRRCSYCQKWLYARYKRQIFCSTKCRQKHYTHTEEFKAHRRQYMREYNQLLY